MGIKITLQENQLGALLESLRYAGVIGDLEDAFYNDKIQYKFTLYAPKGLNEKAWEMMNKKRMRTFSIKVE